MTNLEKLVIALEGKLTEIQIKEIILANWKCPNSTNFDYEDLHYMVVTKAAFYRLLENVLFDKLENDLYELDDLAPQFQSLIDTIDLQDAVDTELKKLLRSDLEDQLVILENREYKCISTTSDGSYILQYE